MTRQWFALLFCVLAGAAVAEVATFDRDTVGQPPAGWTCGATGRGTPKWTVEAEPGAGARHLLKQSGRAAFPWCVKNDSALTDGWVDENKVDTAVALFKSANS